jgi:peptide/nickel transport system substrate-binding protein
VTRRIPFVALILVLVAGVGGTGHPIASQSGVRGKRGGRIVISMSAGPTTFNRLFSDDAQTTAITDCLSGHLIRINRQTQQPEAELAQSWKTSPDGRKVTFSLRQGLKFSDGHAATADDVVFTFQLITDPRAETAQRDQFTIGGQRVQVAKIDASTVAFTFPAPQASILRLFDGVPIVPKHVLEPAYRAGRIKQTFILSTTPDQIVGLGPFRVKSVLAGQRVTLQRNDYFWKTASNGEKLPFLDELVISIDPNRSNVLLKFQNGETDLLSPMSADDAGALAQLERQGRIKVHDLGPSFIREVLWFNLNDGKQSPSGRSPVDAVKLGWFKELKFRQAISHAIDRQAIVNLVFAGRATPQFAFLSAGDRVWFNPNVPRYPHDANRAKQLLSEAGFAYRADRKVLQDAQGRPVAFTLATNTTPLRQKIAALIQEDLAKIGIRVSLATIESKALTARFEESFDYEAGLLAIQSGDTDPASNQNVLGSKGTQHWWYPKQTQPATAWEARIDELMRQLMTTVSATQRKRQFDEVQKIMAEQQAFIFLVSRHLMVASKTNIGNLKPALLPDFVLWNSEELFRN